MCVSNASQPATVSAEGYRLVNALRSGGRKTSHSASRRSGMRLLVTSTASRANCPGPRARAAQTISAEHQSTEEGMCVVVGASLGGLFITTNPDASRCFTSRSAVIRPIASSAS
jgi:hypothetical protein